jgi:hypothetical protein
MQVKMRKIVMFFQVTFQAVEKFSLEIIAELVDGIKEPSRFSDIFPTAIEGISNI